MHRSKPAGREWAAHVRRPLAVLGLAASIAAAQPSDAPLPTSIWDGVFTMAQADRGRAVYPGPCGMCHGARLNGAPDDPDMLSTPPVAGAKFLRNWDGRSLAALLEYTRATMPQSNPGFLSAQEYVDLIAYMLFAGGLPAGRQELPADPRRLATIVIHRAPCPQPQIGATHC